MGKAKKAPKFAGMKKIVTQKAIKHYKDQVLNPSKKDLSKEKLPRNVPTVSSALFFTHNTSLGPPYRVLVDTNFINFSIQNKLDLEKGMMDCLYAKCTPCITDCVMAELEKLGQKYRVALSSLAIFFLTLANKCSNSLSLAGLLRILVLKDCHVSIKEPMLMTVLLRELHRHELIYSFCKLLLLINYVFHWKQHKCFIVATCDRDLKRRIRKVPGVPIMYITQHKYSIERLPEATIGGAPRF
ncbi:rRNA-processing protein FCF1-like protein [Gossypium australe]|uniref:rRNA-processing protein FCF1-like protein n=1 Tax=Gossypium australe TaxID=47621 RepID=A0A5B6W214_9ROSI|nr:rRNA-processing protein FCF1-like protein [Gossypium australe]